MNPAVAETAMPDIDDIGWEWHRERALADLEPPAVPCACKDGTADTLAETLDCPGRWGETSPGRWVYAGGCHG